MKPTIKAATVLTKATISPRIPPASPKIPQVKPRTRLIKGLRPERLRDRRG